MTTKLRQIKGIKLSWIVTAIVLFSVCSTFALNTFVGYQTQKKSLTDNTLELNLITATELSRTTQTMIESMQDAMKTAASYFSALDLGSGGTLKQLDFLHETVPYFNSVAIISSDGVVMSTSPSTLQLVGQKLTSAQAHQALQQRKPLISEPYRAITGRLIVMVSHPILDVDGTYRGFISGTIYLQEENVFQKILGNQSSNQSGSYFYVVDGNGNLLYHPDRNRLGENVTANPAVRELMDGKSGYMTLKNTRNEHFIAGFSLVEKVGWGIVSQTPQNNVGESVRYMISRMALISAPLLALLLALVIWYSLRLSGPLNRLAQLASVFNRGESFPLQMSEKRHWNFETNELYKAITESFRVMDGKTKDLSLKANTDPLTGLANRRFMESIIQEWTNQKMPFSVVMLDLDHFKSVNDAYGHQKGDEVLVFLADCLRSEKRDIDYGCRYGGEEFTLLLPNMDLVQAYELAEKIRTRVANNPSPIGKPVTLSLGISTYPLAAQNADELFRQADEALYQAKQNGRNRTVVYSA